MFQYTTTTLRDTSNLEMFALKDAIIHRAGVDQVARRMPGASVAIVVDGADRAGG